MVDVPSWVVLNFFTAFLLVLLLIFQNRTSRLQKGRMYSAILFCTLILVISESIGHFGEMYPDDFLFLARIGYFIIFIFDPVDIMYAVNYVDCWMDDDTTKSRLFFRNAFKVFSIVNAILVSYSVLFNTRWFFYFEDGIYYRGHYFMIRAVVLMIFICLLMAYTIVFRKHIANDYKNSVLFLPIFSLLGAVLQVVFLSLNTTYAGISLGCVIVFFFFQSKDVNIDYLTGVLNRRGLDIRMQEKVKASKTTGNDFIAVMMDIDFFKDINDTCGHDEGDRAIKHIADLLVSTFDSKAIIGRFGGDEFCVIVDDNSNEEIETKIAEIREKVSKLCKKYSWPKRVGISCGYNKYMHDCGLTAKEFQDFIDKLMYEEKEKHHKR